ncbi:hypothetical protein [Bradyrhizobium sp. 35]|uniref:hypothetical protein n=1 Tax=Bradyrhizobium sp. 35 TaxID=2782670 RepID=UPI001FFA17F8
MIRGDGEGHQLLKRHAVLGIDVEQRGRNRGESQALLHHVDRGEEAGGDVLFGLALLAQSLERAELVERVQRLGYASTVLLAAWR